MFEDEASFWLDGTLHRTWARVGCQPRVDTYGQRKTGHVFAAITLESKPQLMYQFAEVFNGKTFFEFLRHLVARIRRKIFLVIDNAPCHNLEADGKLWLEKNRHRIELCRLPPYSPEYNAAEGIWKETRKHATHNRFYRSQLERDLALTMTFQRFQRERSSLAGYVRRFL